MLQEFKHDRLIIFTRYPVPGRTKTRLIPVLGAVGAADLQRRLTERILATARSFALLRRIDLEVCFTGGSEGKMRCWLDSGVSFSRQALGNLGLRMNSAFINAFRKGAGRVVLLGTDIPELKTDHLRQAFDELTENGLVIGPSTDGGYWLIGMNRPADLFQGINWGTGAVLDQTLDLANKQGLRVKQLDPLTDIDTVDDLKKCKPGWVIKRPYVSVIIPALNEEKNIEATIHGALDDEAEIIIVDGGSADETVKRAVRAGARIEVSPRGRAVQQNRGAGTAGGGVLLFLHADTLLPPGYIHHIFEVLIDHKTVLGAFRFRTDLDRPLMRAVEFLTNIRSCFLKLPYGDQGFFMRKSIFDKVGGFQEAPVAEDLLLVRQLSRLGNIKISEAHIITSGRRWRAIGVIRTILINQIILAGLCLGISPHALAGLYRMRG